MIDSVFQIYTPNKNLWVVWKCGEACGREVEEATFTKIYFRFWGKCHLFLQYSWCKSREGTDVSSL